MLFLKHYITFEKAVKLVLVLAVLETPLEARERLGQFLLTSTPTKAHWYIEFEAKTSMILKHILYSGAPRAREARAWEEPHSLVNLPIPENLAIT